MCPSLTREELEVRRPVWLALSELFLDTDVSLARAGRARQLADSPYSEVELERILIEEVHPVCSRNLASVAGEWAGFDPAWLERKIIEHAASRWPLLLRIGSGGLTVRLSDEWRATRQAIAAVRALRAPG